jgi:hypothetical protein
MTDTPPDDDRTVEELADDVAEHNADPLSRREAIELELQEEGRSEEGELLGDEID